MTVTPICASETFELDKRGDLQVKTPRKGEWPFQDEPANANALSLDNQLGLWVPIQGGRAITGPVERKNLEVPVTPGNWAIAYFQPITVTNPSTVVPLRAEISLLFKTYVHLPEGVGALDVKVWHEGETEPGWDEVATHYSQGFTWMQSHVADASAWIDPGQTVTINSGMRYGIGHDSNRHTVRFMEMHPVGFTFHPWPLQDPSDHRVTPPEPDYDVWVNDFGATEGAAVTDAVARANTLAFQAAIDAAAADGNRGKVRVPAGTYCLMERQQVREPMIQLRDATHLLMHGDTVLLRRGWYPMVGNWAATDTFGGYDGPKSWTLEGGTLDGNAQWAYDGRNTSPMMNVSHGGGIIEGVTFRNQYANHAIDLTGATGMIVNNCRFEGFLPSRDDRYNNTDWPGTVWSSTGFPYIEAIQLDHARSGSGHGGAEDGTGVDGLTVTNCTFSGGNNFGPWPIFVGAHTWPADSPRSVNILIENNTVRDYLGAAVRLIACDQVTIRNNVFAGSHDDRPYGALDDGSKGCLLLHALGSTHHCTNVTIENNRLQDTGGPHCEHAAISVNEPWWGYGPRPDAQSDWPRVATTINREFQNLRILNNRIVAHQGTYAIAAIKNAPRVEIRGNRWSDLQTSQGDLFSADMTNVTDNGPE
ncbi:right-handed parallel beta-helix repeat-containing protein [Streptomyces sp. NPDC050095]|uniref:right-handed parallel beta-helix repeat-containing protein n=1 Tax=unclassified Streptomyces TaxID=2593676 RepID=UPI003420D943